MTDISRLHVSTCDVKPINIDWNPESETGEYQEPYPYWEEFAWEDEHGRDWQLVANGSTVVCVSIAGTTYRQNEFEDLAADVDLTMPPYRGPCILDEDDMATQDDCTTHEHEYEFGEDEFEALFDVEPYQYGSEGPMMNYWYPVEEDAGRYSSFDPVDAALQLKDLPLCVVEVEGAYGIALTGGGMDLSWEICAAYVALGKCPPIHFADLPRMAEQWSDRKEMAYQGMKRSLEFMVENTQYRLDRLVEMYANVSKEGR